MKTLKSEISELPTNSGDSLAMCYRQVISRSLLAMDDLELLPWSLKKDAATA